MELKINTQLKKYNSDKTVSNNKSMPALSKHKAKQLKVDFIAGKMAPIQMGCPYRKKDTNMFEIVAHQRRQIQMAVVFPFTEKVENLKTTRPCTGPVNTHGLMTHDG